MTSDDRLNLIRYVASAPDSDALLAEFGRVFRRSSDTDSRTKGTPAPGNPAWMDSREARVYVGCKSMKGWCAWRKRYAVVPRADGRVAKLDLDRVRKLQRAKKRHMHPNSLANLNRGLA